jgi:predicted MFS family arabinose efflux permease
VSTTPASAYRRPYRWLVLAAYLPIIGLSQLLWLNFAPLIEVVQHRYGVSELVASTLILVFPLIYVLLSTPAGLLVDRRGYRFAIGLGAVIQAVAACLRIADNWFAALLIGQIGIAIAQPYVVNGITKLVNDWFAPDESALATGIGTMGMFIGMAVGMATTPWMVDHLGFRTTMVAFALLSAASAGLFFLVVKPNENVAASPPAPSQAVGPLLRNRQLVLLLVITFLGMGEFNGLTTWLEPILGQHGISASDAGLVGGVLIVGGIVGAGLIPALAGKLGRRKPFLIACALVAAVSLYPMCATSHFSTLVALAALHGFALLPAVALLLDMAAQLAGERLAGAATGLMMLTGNAGGLIVSVAVPLCKGGSGSYQGAILMLASLLAVAVLVASRFAETSALPAPEAASG